MTEIPPKEMSSRKKRAIETKKRIKAVADKLISEREYEDITIAEIAQLANISIGGFYHYFASKEELFFSAYADFDNELEKYVKGRTYDSYKDAIRDIIRYHGHCANDLGSEFQARFIRVQLSTHSQYFLSPKRFLCTHLTELIQKGIENGEFRADCHAERVCADIIRMARGNLYDWALRLGQEPAGKQSMLDLEYILYYYSVDKS